MIDWLFDASKKVLDVGLEAWKQDQARKELRNAVQGRLCRELRYVEHILLEFCVDVDPMGQVFDARAEADAAKLFRALSTEAFDTLSSSPAPLSAFLTEAEIQPGFSRPDRYQDYRKRIANVSISDLVERCYLRVKILRQRALADLPLGDVDYVLFLVRTVIRSLKTE
ncbi:MAG: hypothetical protein EOO27_38950 [Comamonadaceae bacterium]|nr:MAG: hypothetical protein EOO27_38950 [Comamonadaceae bacterium]